MTAMAGVYYVTVLPETSKLEQGIREAGRRAESGMKIRPMFDASGAEQAGQTAGRDIQRGLDSSGAGRVGRMLRIDGAQETGRKAGTEIDRGLSGAKVGAGLNRQVAQEMAPGNASRIGTQYGQQLGNSVESGASGGIKKLGALLGGLAIGNAVKTGLKAVLDAGMEFENNLNTMGAVSGATEAQLGQVATRAKQLGADASLVGASAGSAAEAMTELAKGGFTVQQSMDAAKGALQLAGAAGVDAATAATIQSDTLHTFALNADQAGKAADILAGAANGSSVEIGDIAQSLAAGGSVAHGLGVSLTDTASTIGMFANMGIKGSDAGTSMKTALLQLTNSSKPVVGAFEELGVKAFDAQGKFIGMRGLMDQLNSASKRMTTEQYQAAAATAFGTDGVRFAMLAAQQGTKGFDDMTAAVNRSGVAAEVAAARTKGLPGAWNNFKNQLDGLKLALYDKLKTPLAVVLNYASTALEKLTPIIENGAAKIGAFFEKNAPAIKTFGEAIAGAFANPKAGDTLGNLGKVAKDLGPAFKDVGPALKDVASAIGELGTGALSGIVIPAIKLFGDTLKFIADNSSWLGPIIAGLAIAIGSLKVANAAAGNLKTLGDSVANICTPLTIATTWAQVAAMRAHTAALVQFTIAIGGSTAAQNASLLTTIRFNLALGFFVVKQYAMAAASKAAAAAQWLWNAAMSANPIMLIVLALVAVGVALWAFFTKTETGRKLWDKIWKGIKAVTQAVVDWVMNTAVPWLKQAWDKIAAAAMWLWQNAIKPVFDGIKGVIEAVVGWIMNTAVPWVQKAWKDFSNGLDYIVAVAKEVWSQIKEKFTNVVDFVTGLPDKIRSAASGMWDGIKDAFKGVINWVIRAWNSLSFTIPSVEVFGQKIGGATLSVPKLNEFYDGGHTGPGSKYQPAGIVHADEFVLSKAARASIEGDHPGLLDFMNRTGGLPLLRGYAEGGTVTASEISRMGGGTVNLSLLKAVRKQFPNVGLNSAKTDHDDDGGFHPKGMAIDLAPDDAVAAWMFENRKALNLGQIIYGGAGGKFNYYNVKGVEAEGQKAIDIFGSGVVFGQHSDHIHAMANGEVAGDAATIGGSVSGAGGATGGQSGAATYGNAGGASKFTTAEAAKQGGVVPVWVDNWPSSIGAATSGGGTTNISMPGGNVGASTSASTDAPAKDLKKGASLQDMINETVRIGKAKGMTDADIESAAATLIAESNGKNYANSKVAGSTDRPHDAVGSNGKSLGVMQQQSGMGWGTDEQLMDPTYAIGKYYERLAAVAGRDKMSVAARAQAVQQSAHADGSNYAAKIEEAKKLIGSASTATTSPGTSTAASTTTDGTGVGASTSGSSTVASKATAKKNADQSVDDHQYRLKRAQDALDELKAKTHTAKQLEAAERRVTVATRELADAKERQTTAANNLTKAQQAETKTTNTGEKKTDDDKASGEKTGALNGSDFGKTFVSGVLETIGLDGSVFSNPFEWPTVKSAMAGINWLGGLAKGGTGKGTGAGAATSATAGGFTEGAADAVGLGGFLKNITNPVGAATGQTGANWDPKSGSPKLANADFNPANTGGSTVATQGTNAALSTFVPAAVPANPGTNRAGDDNRVIVNAPGQNAEQIYGKFRTEQAARTRTTVVKG